MNKCVVPSHNHSGDLVSVYHGGFSPLLLCGYHATWDLEKLLKETRKVAK